MLLFYSCANVTSPTGGAKDTKPPVIIKEIPAIGSVNFTGNKIRVFFDEFVNIKDINSQFISSPPLREMPKTLIKGKSIEFSFTDTLKENTTYNFNFGNSIVDFNESNALVNYYYAFSTGNYIDSLKIFGNVLNAFDLKSVENVLIMLYDNNNFFDSIPYKKLPSYIGKTDKSGNFQLSYIREGNYKIFALNDLNKNRFFDQTKENIAFLDSLIIPACKIEKDTLNADTTKLDTIVKNNKIVYTPNNLQLFLFEDTYNRQFIKGFSRKEKNILEIIFNEKLNAEYKINGLNAELLDVYNEQSENKDTLLVWIKDSTVYNKDTLITSINYLFTDSLGKYENTTDTLKFIYKKNKILNRKKPKVNTKSIGKNKIGVEVNVKNGGVLDINKPLYFTCLQPIEKLDTSKIYLFQKQEVKRIPINFKIRQDSLIKRKYFVDFKVKEAERYILKIDTNAVFNKYLVTNDSIVNEFGMQSADFYGNIILLMEDVKSNVIVQLLNSKDIIVDEFSFNKNEKININYLPAASYKLKLIYDQNNNKKWDTGNYLKHQQPEKVLFYKEAINVRANWDVEITWKLPN